MLSENGRYLSRFFAWWFGELRACLPNAVVGFLFGASERLEVALDPGEARFVLRRNDNARELGSVALDDTSGKAPSSAARRLLRRAGAPTGQVTLRLPAGQVLRPNVELPIAAAENLREVLAFEMDRHTPFSSEGVLFDFRVAGSDAELQRLNVELLIARKHDVDRARALAATMGLSPDHVTGPVTGEDCFNLLPAAERPRPGRLLPRLVGAAAVVTLALAGVALGLWFERRQETLERLEARVAELRATTGETGRLEEKVAHLLAISGYLVEQKLRRPQMVEILDEVTRRLPDEHWLISYSFRDGTIRLAGYSDDPSSVLRLLEQSDLFSEARFAAPVTMDPRIGKERFNMVATVAREDGAQ
ncbi:MAG: PilN domain-containing protein [Paracoccaceae bacterium]